MARRPKGRKTKKPGLAARSPAAAKPPARLTAKSEPAPQRRAGKHRSAAPAPAAGDGAFPIVGMGASAGGLEALQQFFSRMPAESGLGFVLVPHLDATHKSALTELLQRETTIPVVEVVDGMPVTPDRIHIIPPNATMTIGQGKLHLRTPRETGMTIDTFLRSLAQDQADCAIAVILSGGGSDGTLGVKAIKEHGGLAFAQSGDGLRHGSMPHSAVASGLIDITATAEEMPAKLLAYAGHLRRLQREAKEDGFRAEVRRYLIKIYTLLRARTGHDFSRYKDSTFIRRLQRRMQVTQIVTAKAYVELLRKDPREIDLLFQDLLIGVTQFFRDHQAFAVLAKQVIPKIVAAKGRDDQVRVWVPGCATGEEAYSLAMLIRESLDKKEGPAPKVQIFATDIDSEALEAARLGRYNDRIAKDVSAERLERFFVRDGDAYCVTKDIREMCIFSVHNLIKDAPFSKLDLVSCRNLLIYLDASLQNRVIPLFHFALRHGGYLFLGPSENITQHVRLFTRIDAKRRIFRARPVAPDRGVVDFPLSVASYRGQLPVDRPPLPGPTEETLARRALRLVEAYVPAYVIVDDRYETVHFSGKTGRYLQPTAGTANLNLFNILDPGLRSEVRMAVHRAAKGGERAVQENVPHKVNGDTHALTIVVEPLPGTDGTRHYLVVFQDRGALKPPPRGDGKTPDAGRDDTIDHLETELLAARERLQSTVEELETSNEEMKASNEEFQSVNEELQSSNEELETSKEELQSVNEELETVNAELNSKVEGLERANNDRKNLLESTQIATMFLDNSLRLKSFTPAITDVFKLIDSDTGRPITDIASRLAYDGLERDVRRVIRTLERAEREVPLTDGSAIYMTRILPYRTVDNVIDGVVITFIDITERKRAEEDRARLASIVETSNDAIIGLTPEGQIATWNHGAEQIYGYTADEATGQPLSLIIPAERADELATILGRLRRPRGSASVETLRRTKDGRQIHVASTVSGIHTGSRLSALSAIERDISEAKRAEARTKILVAELNHRVKNTLAAVLTIAGTTVAGSASLQDFRPAFEGRIRALANTHELLSASGWRGADLARIVAAEMEPYGEGRATVAGGMLMLNSTAAGNFAMIVHELAINAAKYGALSKDKGRVEIRWSVDGVGRRLIFRWTECDGPAAAKPAKLGFGLRLIQRTASHDLQGQASFEFGPTGLSCVIDADLNEAEGGSA